MTLRPFTLDDLSEINGWQRGHGLPDIPERFIPSTGFITPGVCAGFINRGEASLCIVDWVVTNPEATSEARHEGLNLLLDAFEAVPGRLVFWSHEGGIIQRARSRGASIIGAYWVMEKRGE
jgi:hypothetical protein